jgi:stress response protein SCP2
MKNGLNWDVVQYPSYKEKPNTYGYVDAHLMMLTKQSKYKDQAMQVSLHHTLNRYPAPQIVSIAELL